MRVASSATTLPQPDDRTPYATTGALSWRVSSTRVALTAWYLLPPVPAVK